ncbi:MAG: cupin domain-containing protein [Verrucomicrobiota bacterium]
MIIRAAQQQQLKGSAIREGQGDAFSTLLVKNRLREKSSIVAIAHNVLPPGSAWGERVQHNTEEVFYILRGEATVTHEGETGTLAPGDLVLSEHGQRLAIRNDGDEALEFLSLMLAQPKETRPGFLTQGQTPYSRL